MPRQGMPRRRRPLKAQRHKSAARRKSLPQRLRLLRRDLQGLLDRYDIPSPLQDQIADAVVQNLQQMQLPRATAKPERSRRSSSANAAARPPESVLRETDPVIAVRLMGDFGRGGVLEVRTHAGQSMSTVLAQVPFAVLAVLIEHHQATGSACPLDVLPEDVARLRVEARTKASASPLVLPMAEHWNKGVFRVRQALVAAIAQSVTHGDAIRLARGLIRYERPLGYRLCLPADGCELTLLTNGRDMNQLDCPADRISEKPMAK